MLYLHRCFEHTSSFDLSFDAFVNFAFDWMKFLKSYWISVLVRFSFFSLSFNYASCLILKVTLLISDCSHLAIQLLLKLTNFNSDRSHLTSVVVRIVFDFRRFLEFHHRWIREINEDTKQLIVAIIIFNQSFSLSVIDIRITSRVDSEFLNYSSEWAINIIRLREDIQIFRNVISIYRTFEVFRNFLQLKHSNSVSSSNFSSDVSSSEFSRRFEASRNFRFRNVLKNSN